MSILPLGRGIFPACTHKRLAISAQVQQYHEWEVVIGLLILFYQFSDCFTLQIDSVFKTFDRFFELNQDVKEKYTKDKGTSSNGWDALERERFVIPCQEKPVMSTCSSSLPIFSLSFNLFPSSNADMDVLALFLCFWREGKPRSLLASFCYNTFVYLFKYSQYQQVSLKGWFPLLWTSILTMYYLQVNSPVQIIKSWLKSLCLIYAQY